MGQKKKKRSTASVRKTTLQANDGTPLPALPESPKYVLEEPNDRWQKITGIIVFLLLCVIVLAVPTVFSAWTTECGRIKVLIAHLAILTGILLVVLQIAVSGRIRIKIDVLTCTILGYLALVLVSTMISPFPYASRNELWRISMLVALFGLVVYAVSTPRRIRVLSALMELAVLLVCAYAIAQKMGYDIITFSQSPTDRVFASIGNPNMFAGFLLLMFWLMVGIGLDSKSLLHRAFLLMLCGAMLTCLLFTYTKGAWIAFVVSAGLFLVWIVTGWRFPYSISRRRRLWLGGVVIVVCLVVAAVFHRPVLNRLYTLRDSAKVRLVYWSGAVGVIRDNPIMGAGAGTFQIVYPDKRPPDFRAYGSTYNTLHAHCEPLVILTEMGLLGIGAFTFLLVAFYRCVFKTLRAYSAQSNRRILIGLSVGITPLLLHNLVDVNIRWYTTSIFFWLALGLTVSIRQMEGSNNTENRTLLPVGIPLLPRVILAMAIVTILCFLAKTYVIDTFESQIHLRKATDMSKRGKWNEALAAARKAIQKDTSNLRAYYQEAYCHYEQKMYGEAIRAYLHLENLAPNFCQLRYNLGVLYSLMGRWEEAASRFVEAKRMGITPSGFSLTKVLAQLRSKKGDHEKKLGILKAMAEMNPRDPLAYNRLGIHYYEKGRLSEAAKMFQKALHADIKYVPALNNLAGVYYRQQKYTRAIDICKKILRINLDAHKTRVNLGRAYYLTKQHKKAFLEWQEVLRRSPGEKEAQACIQKLSGRRESARKVK